MPKFTWWGHLYPKQFKNIFKDGYNLLNLENLMFSRMTKSIPKCYLYEEHFIEVTFNNAINRGLKPKTIHTLKLLHKYLVAL